MKIVQYPQMDAAATLALHIQNLLALSWPAKEGKKGVQRWPDSPWHKTSFVLMKQNCVVAHAAVVEKEIVLAGETYRVGGISEVTVHPAQRGNGLALLLLKEAYEYCEAGGYDVSLFSCKPELVSMYSKVGWHPVPSLCLVGGSLEKPFRGDSLGIITMAAFFSTKAQRHRADFLTGDIVLELGEGKLW